MNIYHIKYKSKSFTDLNPDHSPGLVIVKSKDIEDNMIKIVDILYKEDENKKPFIGDEYIPVNSWNLIGKGERDTISKIFEKPKNAWLE